MYATRFTVEGAGQFPLDMLRYDACYPVGSADVSCIGGTGGLTGRDRRKVSLWTSHPSKGQNRLTDDRWKSFGWRIVEVEPPVKCA